MYNWSKNLVDQLQNHLYITLQWVEARQVLLNSIALQKLSLFEEQPYIRRNNYRENPFIDKLSMVENLIKLLVPNREVIQSVDQLVATQRANVSQQQSVGFATHQQQVKFMLHQRFAHEHRVRRHRQTSMNNGTSYRNTIGSAHVWKGFARTLPDDSTDLLQRHGIQLLALTASNARKKEVRERLSNILVCGSGNTVPAIDTRTLNTLCRHARIQHMVYSPLLFLPRWRTIVAATRNHSFDNPPASPTLPACPVLITEPASPQLATERIKTKQESSTSSIKQSFLDLRRGSITSFSDIKTSQSKSQVPPPSPNPSQCQQQGIMPPQHPTDALNVAGRRRHLTGGASDDRWHQVLSASLFKEYIQYLQSHGFKTLPKQATKQGTTASGSAVDRSGFRNTTGEEIPTTYLLRSLRNGIIILKMFIKEPYFTVGLYSIENQRLKRRPHLYTHQMSMDQFIIEIDSVRVLIHVHSFVHDYHLRTLGAYLAGRQLIFNRGYHLSDFLSNFTEFYHKAPNFARNMIHTNRVKIPNTGVSPEQLFNYLLSKEKQYNMKVMRMTPIIPDESLDMQETEYVLIQIGTCHPKQQTIQVRLAEEYESIMLVSKDDLDLYLSELEDSDEEIDYEQTLYLRYYLILTSKREMYPSHVFENGSRKKLNKAGCEEGSRFRLLSVASSLCSTPTNGSSSGSTPQNGSNCASDDIDRLSRTNTIQRNGSDAGSSLSSTSVTSTSVSASARAVARSTSVTRSGSPRNTPVIRKENINYQAYYSLYEIIMEKLLLTQADLAVKKIKSIFERAKIHCRRDSLWKKLTARSLDDEAHRGVCKVPTFDEVEELLGIVQVENIEQFDPRVSSFVRQPLPWHQALVRLLQHKCQQNVKSVTSSDGNRQHITVMSPTSPDTVMVISMDLRYPNNTAIRYVRKALTQEDAVPLDDPQKAFFSAFINMCCFQLWAFKL